MASGTLQVTKEGVNTKADYIVFGVLLFTNILNYVDRYTVAGVLTAIQTDFKLSDSKAGLLQTAFISALAVGSPIFGYLGDRYNRKLLIIGGMLLWTASVLGGSFVPGSSFAAFAIMRALFGFGQAAYVTISPSLIADIFTGERRSLMLMLYYFAIPVGSGLGYIVGSHVASAAGNWRWGMRATTILDGICLVFICIFLRERQSENAEMEKVNGKEQHSSYKNDLIAIFKNGTFISSTFAYTCCVFVAGTVSWWMPSAMHHIMAHSKHLNSTSQLVEKEKSHTTFIFGVITMISGFTGVAAGSVLSNLLSTGRFCFAFCSTPRSDPIICAVGTFIALPTFVAVVQLMPKSIIWAEVFIFFCITGLCFIWAINVNLYISVVTPDKRNSANGIQILVSHVLGDGSGPYIIGFISDKIRGDAHSPFAHWNSLSLAFYVANAMIIPAILLFIVAAITYPKDRAIFLRSTNNSMVEFADLATGVEIGAPSNKISPLVKAPAPLEGFPDGHTATSPIKDE